MAQHGLRGRPRAGSARERYARDVALIGLSTHHGTVTAASDWDGPAERKRVQPGLLGSYDELCHDAGVLRFLLRLRDNAGLARHLEAPRLQRAIGASICRRPSGRAIPSTRGSGNSSTP